MRHPELPRDVAGPHPVVRQLHDPLPDDVGQGAAVDEHPAQLVHAAVACAMIKRKRKGGLVFRFLYGTYGTASVALAFILIWNLWAEGECP